MAHYIIRQIDVNTRIKQVSGVSFMAAGFSPLVSGFWLLVAGCLLQFVGQQQGASSQ